MIVISRKSTGAGIRKLSELEIDIDKDWMGYSIDNLKGINYSGIFSINAWGMNYDLNGAVLWIGGDAGEMLCNFNQALMVNMPSLDLNIGGALITFDYLGGDNVLNIISSADMDIRGISALESSSVMYIHTPQLWIQLDPAGWLRFRYDSNNNEIVIDKVLPLLINDQSGTGAWTRWRYDSANNEIVIESGLPIRIPNLVGGGGGITKLSQLEIDVDKDWAGHYIANIPMIAYIYDPTGGTYYLAGDSQSPELNSIITQFIRYPAGIINTVFYQEDKAVYNLVGWRPFMVKYPSDDFYYSDSSISGVYIYNTGTGSYDEVLRIFTGLYEGSFSVGKGIEWKRYSTFIIKKSNADPNPALDIKIPITSDLAGTGYFHVNSDEVTINTLTGDITLSSGSGVIQCVETAGTEKTYAQTYAQLVINNGVQSLLDLTVCTGPPPRGLNATLSMGVFAELGLAKIESTGFNLQISGAGILDLTTSSGGVWIDPVGYVTIKPQTGGIELEPQTAGYPVVTNTNLVWENDGQADIGTSTTQRPNNIYVKTSIQIGGSIIINNTNTISTSSGDLILNPSGETTTGKDIEITDNTKGVILKDRTTGTRYRLKVDNGTLGIEAVA